MKKTMIFGSILMAVILSNLIGVHFLLARKDYRVVSRYNRVQIIEKNQKMGIMNAKGTVLFPLLYETIDTFHYGIARVVKEEKKGYVDTTGKWIIPPVYDDLNLFNDFGLALALQNGKYGWINKKNEIVIPFVYSQVLFDFNRNGQTAVSKDGKRYGCINIENKVVLDFVYERMEFFDIYIWVKKDSVYGLYNLQGETLLPLKYERIQKSERPVIPFKQNGKWGIYNSITQESKSLPYDSIGSFSESLASVIKDGKSGYIGFNGELLIPPKFNSASDFHNEKAEVSLTYFNDTIDKEGNRVPLHRINYFFGILINEL